MQRQLFIKIAIVLILGLLLLIPITMIRSIVKERMFLRDDVVRDIAKSSAEAQSITGPVIVVPYKRTLYIPVRSQADGQRLVREDVETGNLYFLPELFKLDGKLQVEKRYRGIYEAQLYHLASQITGEFAFPKNFGIEDNFINYSFGEPYIAIGITDVRGINNQLKLTLNDQELVLAPGTESSKLGAGLHASLSKEQLQKGGTFNFAISFKLQGTSSLSITPVGRETEVTLSSNWPHPSFTGDFLPISREVSNEGFKARWQTNFFATSMEKTMGQCIASDYCSQFNTPSFSIGLINTVDQYLKTDRAIKYAALIIGITFIGFFFFEIIKRLTIHPIQYSFVGVALATFFLLLLSLAEYIGFGWAYFCSAGACIALISFYVTGILPNRIHCISFTGMLTTVYLVLYIILSAEDYSLLMGSILVFGLLTAAMVVTRKLDWYKVASLPIINGSVEEEKSE